MASCVFPAYHPQAASLDCQTAALTLVRAQQRASATRQNWCRSYSPSLACKGVAGKERDIVAFRPSVSRPVANFTTPTHLRSSPVHHTAACLSYCISQQHRPSKRIHVACPCFTFNVAKVSPSESVDKESAELAKKTLFSLLDISNRGLNRDPSLQAKILEVVETLGEIGRGSVTADASLSATWKLLWTTEKETLFIFEKAGWFGTKAGDAFQPIDVSQSSLRNIITFPPTGAFEVDASIEIASDQRVNFRFQSARIKTESRSFGVPPFGRGWFENVYMDEDIRVSKDSRGDVLITERVKEVSLSV
eukprot:TRINITY_DN17803_c0_g1_i1.p1 TRINITY_DN17803_c0_g1~~TRINITY_DN17803_c0_g1_i1.p1  ORF type:complete len:306 (+),score=33.33 TRINITY_DN17803_c0_g1_i1:185-1102(+)